MTYIDWLGWIAASITLATFSMKTMIPLRATAIGSNLAFICYGAPAGIYPVVVLHGLLLPFNIIRLLQMRRLIESARTASANDFSFEWIRPYTTLRQYRAGETIFKKGDKPDLLYYVSSGLVSLAEIDTEIRPGSIFGEIAFFAPNQRRTVTAVCKEDTQLNCLNEALLKQLYFQNPAFGYYLIQLVATRLSEDVVRLERHKD